EKLSRIKSRSKKQIRSSSAARAELLSVLFEKNLAAEAISRVYEASQNGRIDRLERDRLLLKYKQQLDSLNQKIEYLQPVADFADLTALRNNLVLFLGDRISSFDKKLLELSKSGVSSEASAADVRLKEIIEDTLKVEPTAPLDQKLVDVDEKSIEQLNREMLQTLQQLEQVEIDKDQLG
ncbi:MAG TPA: hypothetical protein VGE97_02580, partial [Nitrososphaera sp.]